MGLGELRDYSGTSRGSRWLLPGIFVALSLIIVCFGEPGREWARYDRVWLGQGETWRLITGHFTHLGWAHFALNSAGVALVWFLVGSNYALRTWLLILGTTLLTMDIAFWTLNPELLWYVGMSGMLHGILVAGVLSRFPRIDTEGWVLLALIVAKIAWEQLSGPVPGSEMTAGGPVIVDAHLYGALGGLLGAIAAKIRVAGQGSI